MTKTETIAAALYELDEELLGRSRPWLELSKAEKQKWLLQATKVVEDTKGKGVNYWRRMQQFSTLTLSAMNLFDYLRSNELPTHLLEKALSAMQRHQESMAGYINELQSAIDAAKGRA